MCFPLPAIPGIPQALVSFASGASHLPCAVLSVISDFEIPFIPKKLEVPNGEETTSFNLSSFCFDQTH